MKMDKTLVAAILLIGLATFLALWVSADHIPFGHTHYLN
jgi:hypothetical protein